MPRTLRKVAKICLVGDTAVGKSSLAQRFVQEEFTEKYAPTPGTRMYAVELTIPYSRDLQVALELYIQDLVGQKGFMRMVRETFFHGVLGIVAVCDLTKPDSVPSLHEWILAAQELAGPAVVHIAVNKADLHRRVPQEDLEKIGQTYDCPVILTSAKSGQGVDELFQSVATHVVAQLFREEEQAAGEADLYTLILELAAERHPDSVAKAEFFQNVKGISYDSLTENATRLEQDGYVQIHWLGPGEFSVVATEAGLKACRAAS
jgi:small GTP-binding protein